MTSLLSRRGTKKRHGNVKSGDLTVVSLEGVDEVFDLNELIISIARKPVDWKPRPTDSE